MEMNNNNQQNSIETDLEKISSGTTHKQNEISDDEDYNQEDFVSQDGPPSMDKPTESAKKKLMDLEKIQKSIEAYYEVISTLYEKAIVVIGRTGAGKSSLVNYLIRPKEIRGIEKENDDDKLIVDAEQQAGYPKIGHKHDAETRIPNKYYDKNNDVTYWDCPGFDDTGGPVKDIPNAFFIKRVFEKAKNVKIILVIDKKDLSGRADAIKTLVDNLTNLFGNVNTIKDVVSLIITKAGYRKNVINIQSVIKDLLSSECFVDKPSSGQELLKQLLHSEIAKDGKSRVTTKSKVCLFRKPKQPGYIGLDNYNEIMEVVNGTQFVPTPQVKVTVSQESMLYAIELGHRVKKRLIDHFDEFRKKIVHFCVIPSSSVENMNLIELNSLGNEIPKTRCIFDCVVQIDRVEQLGSYLNEYAGNINKTLVNRETKIDVTELSKKIERDSNYLMFLVSINENVYSICDPLPLIFSRMKDGKLQIADNLNLITGKVKAKLNNREAELHALVSNIKVNLLNFMEKKSKWDNTLSPSAKFSKCKENLDTLQDLRRICTKVTDPDSSFKVIIDTLETELIKKYGLEVPQSATDAIRIFDNLSLIDGFQNSEYKKSFQCELKKMFVQIKKNYRKKVMSINVNLVKDISGFIRDFGYKFTKWLEKFQEHDDKLRLLKEATTIVKNLSNSGDDPLIIVSNLHKMLKDIGLDDSVLSCLEQLTTALNNLDELAKLFDNLESYPCDQFVKKMVKLSSKLESIYDKLDHDLSIQDNFECGIQEFIDEIKKYIMKTKSIESSVERLKKVIEELNLLTNEYQDKEVINGKDFIKSVQIAFYPVNPDLTKHFKYLTAPGDFSCNMINNLILLRSSLEGDINWYQTIFPEIFLNLSDPNFVEKNDLINLREITEENFRDFLTKFKKVEEVTNFNEDRKEHLNTLLNAVMEDKMKYGYNGSELSIKGNCIRISKIQHLVDEDVKRIKIKSLGSIVFDNDLKANGVDLLIIAPSWYVKSDENITIDLSGKTPTKLPKATDGKGYTGDGDGQNGTDGLKGLPGNHGGGFYGSGVNFSGLDKLKINVSGGKGQDGQDGGDGASGKPGAPACRANNQGRIGKQIWEKIPLAKFFSREIFIRNYDKTERLKGLPGGNGGDAGKGGEGGESGAPGIIKIFSQKERTYLPLSCNIVKETGAKGINGCSGQPGEGGKHGDDLMVTYHKVFRPGYDKPESVTENIVNVTDIATNGCGARILNQKCSFDHLNNYEACSKCLPVKFDEESFNKYVKAFLEEYTVFLNNLPQSDFLYKFQQLLLKDFKTELVGNGPKQDNDQYLSLGEYSNKFNQYSGTVIDKLLKLRLGNLSEIRTDIIVLNAEYSYVPDKDSGVISLLVTKVADAFSEGYNIVLVPFNLYNKHWVGLVIERKQRSILVRYQDPLQEQMVPNLLTKLEVGFASHFANFNISFTESLVEKQLFNNCGPEVIENFVYYLTGRRVNQDQAVILHSKLLEKNSCGGQSKVKKLNLEHAAVDDAFLFSQTDNLGRNSNFDATDM